MGLGWLRSDSANTSNRKFEKKLQFYAKVKDSVATLNAKKAIGKKKKRRTRQKKWKPFDLSTLSEFLPDIKGLKHSTSASDFKMSCKTKQELVMREGKQMRIVHSHPAFHWNPMTAIQQHLESTQPITSKKSKKRSTKNRKKKAKKAINSKIFSEPPKYNEGMLCLNFMSSISLH